MHIDNRSRELHPMHLHGTTRWSSRATASRPPAVPWWMDSLDAQDGHTYDIAFVADIPGLWMDHCHNLAHPSQGLMAHLMHEGVTTPYRVGGDAHNDPE